MSLLNKALILCLLSLSSCGFQPLYAKKAGDGTPLVLAGVKVDAITGRMGQQLRIQLEDQLNPAGAVPANPTFRLTATILSTSTGIDTSRDGTVSRYNVYLDSRYVLYRNSDNLVVTTGSLRQVGSYSNVANEYFSTYISEDDAIKRGIGELSQLYRERLAAYLTQPDAGQPAPPGKPPEPIRVLF